MLPSVHGGPITITKTASKVTGHTNGYRRGVTRIYTAEYYSAIKRNEIMSGKCSKGPRDCHTKWSKPDKDTYHVILLICACVLSRFSHVQLFVTLWTVTFQAPLSLGTLQAEYWSGLPFPPPGDLLDPGIKSVSPVAPALQADSLPLSLWGSPWHWLYVESLKKKKKDTNEII